MPQKAAKIQERKRKKQGNNLIWKINSFVDKEIHTQIQKPALCRDF
jgi:hypothetical protein